MPLINLHSSVLAVACPKCGVGQGEKCRTLRTNRSTDTHEARWAAWDAAKRPVRRRTQALDSASEVCPSCFRIHEEPTP